MRVLVNRLFHLVTFLSLLLLAACHSEQVGTATKILSQGQSDVVVVDKSSVNKGAGIRLKYHSDDEVVVGGEVRAQLRFFMPANHRLTFKIVPQDSIQLLMVAEHQLLSNAEGVAELEIIFIPEFEGKHYIRLFTQLESGGRYIPQVMVIPVYVSGDDGVYLDANKPSASQVDLPASRF